MGETLGSRLEARDAQRFVGRRRELLALERLLDDEPAPAVVFVHGPGGIGKSTLLREAGRRAVASGFEVRLIDGREAAVDPGAVKRALDGIGECDRPLIVVDSYEMIAALGAALRGSILPALPVGARALIAGRRPPEAGWCEAGWEALTLPLPLGPLDDAEARQLLQRHGIEGEARLAPLLRWADGLPLALAMGADATLLAGAVELRALEDDRALAGALLRRLAGTELGGVNHAVLEVGAIAPTVDAALLAAALPDVDADQAEAWLRGLSFVTGAGARLRLHERVAAALRTELRSGDPGRERELRRRIGDHLQRRAANGRPELIGELLSLIDDPALRRSFALDSGDRFRVDRPRDGDAATAAAALGAEQSSWWPGVRRFFEAAPERVLVVRDARDALAGLAITVTPATAPPWASEDAVLGRWLADARRRAPDGDALLWRNTFDLTGEGDSPVVGLLNTAGIQLCGLPNVRLIYGHADPADEAARELARAIGAVEMPELEVRDGSRVVICQLVDHGEGGILAATAALLYADLGLPPPPARDPAAVTGETVREALRGFHDPLALAASPLAHGATTEQRAASVRSLLREAAAAAFGGSQIERLQRATLEVGYFDEDGGHTAAPLALDVSRSTYFRRLAEASERLEGYLTAARS